MASSQSWGTRARHKASPVLAEDRSAAPYERTLFCVALSTAEGAYLSDILNRRCSAGLFSRRALASLASLVNNRGRRGSFGLPSFRSPSGRQHCVFRRPPPTRGRAEKSRHRFPPDLP